MSIPRIPSERTRSTIPSGGGRSASLALTLLATFAVVFALSVSQSLLVPVLIGLLVSYTLSPVVDKLSAWHLPRAVGSFVVIASLALTGVIVGVATWLAVWWLGLESAALWGIAAGVLNSVPYFGPTVVAIAMFVVAFLQFDSAWQAAVVALTAMVITTFEGMLLTPLIVSRFSRMNPVAVFLGLLFWRWLWGVVGMLLAVPLLMVVKSVADRVDDLRPLGELLGE